VRKDDVPIILEAMKMEIPVHSPGEGTIAKLTIGQGDLVAESQVLAVISQ